MHFELISNALNVGQYGNTAFPTEHNYYLAEYYRECTLEETAITTFVAFAPHLTNPNWKFIIIQNKLVIIGTCNTNFNLVTKSGVGEGFATINRIEWIICSYVTSKYRLLECYIECNTLNTNKPTGCPRISIPKVNLHNFGSTLSISVLWTFFDRKKS